MSIQSLLEYFRINQKNTTASIAKERLQIIVSHERCRTNAPDYLPQLKEELLNVIAKYIPVRKDQVTFELERTKNRAVLELNVMLPDHLE